MTREKIIKDLKAAHVRSYYEIVGIVYHANGCCPDKPIIITANETNVSEYHPDGVNYSCQCACDCWCTNGHGTPSEALAEYEDMTKRKKISVIL